MSLPILPTSPRRNEITRSIKERTGIHADHWLSLFEATGPKRGK